MGAADAAEQVVELDEFVFGEVDGAGDAAGQVGEFVAQVVAAVGEVDLDGAFVGGASFAAQVAGGFEAFEQRAEGAAVEVEEFAEVADGGGAAVPEDAQGEVLGVGEAVGVEGGPVDGGHGAAGGVELEADHLFESGAFDHGQNSSGQFSCAQLVGGGDRNGV